MAGIKDFLKRSIFSIPDVDENRTDHEKLLANDASSPRDSQEEPERIIHKPMIYSCSSMKNTILSLSAAIIILLIIPLLWLSSKKHSELGWVPCGDSPEEARRNGCHYEPMQRSWIPDACYFPEPSNEYHPFDDRQWYVDKKLTIKMNNTNGLQKLRDGEEIVGYTATFHDEHCLYCWRKLAIAVERRLPMIDSKSASFHHSTHCAQLISGFIHDVSTEIFDIHDMYTFSPLMYQTCVPLNWN
ncbi:hypothetical protein B7494_g3026 [Chlorociboria aeruginascens]|nr:hypothetical protein B7494_g3026 [Chlorociboria aeruginascens]